MFDPDTPFSLALMYVSKAKYGAPFGQVVVLRTNIRLGWKWLSRINVLAYLSCGLYYKNITIVNDTSRVVRMTIESDAPSCGVTNDCHPDISRSVICAPREHLLVQASLMMIVIYDCHIFVVQATDHQWRRKKVFGTDAWMRRRCWMSCNVRCSWN